MPDKPQLPDVEEFPVDQGANQEESDFAKTGKLLDLHLRRVTGYGALGAAAILYSVGVGLAIKFAYATGYQAPSWHSVIAILIALFTVPTVLVLAVLRSSSLLTKDADTDSLHAIIGTKVMNLIDRFLDKLVNAISTK
ncbi:MAG: hypothetical protein LBU72_00755 [Burkholderiaceae bacterium]|jgi:hypothetical protein|nr:hypothetical protein [Burkholderiaceae bacterium]